MCGRYRFFDEKNQKLKKLIKTARQKLPPEKFAEISLFEVFPSQSCFAGCWNESRKEVRTTIMQWGYGGFSGKMIINARSETCFDSRFFAGSLPCAIPATGYFEWSEKPRRKYEFAIAEEPFYLGGIWHMENGKPHFVILTEEAGEPQRKIHARQPLLFTYENAKKWCASVHPASLRSLSVSERIIVS